MFIVEALVGASLLALGRRLFWLFVAGVGFVAGLTLATRFLQNSPGWVALLVAVGAGVLGALLATFLERIAIGAVGFIGGGYILLSLFNLLGTRFGLPDWVVVLIGGVIGAVLIFSILDWMLIILSSLVGASMVTEAFSLRGALGLLIFVVLVAAGILIQRLSMRREKGQAKK